MKISLRNSRKTPTPAAPSEAVRAILDVAEQLAQTRGYNGFSYADIAVKLGVTKAGLHYHFPSKEALGRALIERYEADFGATLESINQAAADPREKLRQYAGLYDSVVRNDRMCLCGMLAAEYATLPAIMQAELRRFFDMNEQWLANVIQDGHRSGMFTYKESASDAGLARSMQTRRC